MAPLITRGLPADAPNIIFILVDDHRWDALSTLGHPIVKTPNLDRLCHEGVRFENAFVTTSLCSPSRANFSTGQYARTHGVKNNLTHWNNNNLTFFEPLKAAGYDTAFIGKWHMPGKLPELKGVDRFISFTVQGGQGQYFDCLPDCLSKRFIPFGANGGLRDSHGGMECRTNLPGLRGVFSIRNRLLRFQHRVYASALLLVHGDGSL